MWRVATRDFASSRSRSDACNCQRRRRPNDFLPHHSAMRAQDGGRGNTCEGSLCWDALHLHRAQMATIEHYPQWVVCTFGLEKQFQRQHYLQHRRVRQRQCNLWQHPQHHYARTHSISTTNVSEMGHCGACEVACGHMRLTTICCAHLRVATTIDDCKLRAVAALWASNNEVPPQPPQRLLHCLAHLSPSNNRISDGDAAELAKALAVNAEGCLLSVTYCGGNTFFRSSCSRGLCWRARAAFVGTLRELWLRTGSTVHGRDSTLGRRSNSSS